MLPSVHSVSPSTHNSFADAAPLSDAIRNCGLHVCGVREFNELLFVVVNFRPLTSYNKRESCASSATTTTLLGPPPGNYLSQRGSNGALHLYAMPRAVSPLMQVNRLCNLIRAFGHAAFHRQLRIRPLWIESPANLWSWCGCGVVRSMSLSLSFSIFKYVTCSLAIYVIIPFRSLFPTMQQGLDENCV